MKAVVVGELRMKGGGQEAAFAGRHRRAVGQAGDDACPAGGGQKPRGANENRRKGAG